MFKRNTIFFSLVVFGVLSMALPLPARTVKDQLGRDIILPDDPQRVVALAPNVTEIIYALGQAHRLKGATQFSDYPLDAQKIPRVGSYVHLDLERIVSISPDLCIAIKDGNPIEVIKRLESFNIPVYAVDPRNLDSVMVTILEIGDLFSAAEKATALVEDMRARRLKVKTLVAKADIRPRVFFQIGTTPIVSVGSHTFIHELIELAGGENLAQGPAAYPRFSHEQVFFLSPDVFIITSMTRGEVFEKIKKKWSRWTDMPAVKNHRIHLVDSNILDRPSPRLIDGLELLLKLIHPELDNQ